DSVFTFSDNLTVTQQMTDAYDRNGYILVRNLLSQEEIAKVRHAVEHSKGIQKHAYGRSDGDKSSRLCVWNHPGDDVTGMLVRSHMIAGTMEELMGGEEIYHYHSKLMMKDAKTGGAWCWHQDYGYWYHNGCMFPEMGSVFIPVDDCKKENGCLQVIKGSHRLGRVEHGKSKESGDQMVADNERVQEALKQLELVPVEMSAGDALFFHGNLLHTSSQNTSDQRRWVIIVSFNKKKNNPYKEHHHPFYTPLVKVPNSALLECNNIENLEGKWFLDPAKENKYVDDEKQMLH
ncbi:unnamed protein product, partial [Meganyctiphanes norvegica]